jgi:beta-1,2-xylosyltransferase
LKWEGTLPRARDAASYATGQILLMKTDSDPDSLISGFARYLPNMKATFSIFDQPQIYLSWARRESLIDLGLRGERMF